MDKNKFPKPFSKIVLRFGEAIQVPESASGEAFDKIRDKLDDQLTQTEKTAAKDLKTGGPIASPLLNNTNIDLSLHYFRWGDYNKSSPHHSRVSLLLFFLAILPQLTSHHGLEIKKGAGLLPLRHNPFH